MPDKLKLPPSATLVDDGTQGMALPPGATLAPAAQFPSTSMTDASGQLQMVPHEQLAQRMQQGWKVGPPTQQGDLSASLPQVKQDNLDYRQRGTFGKAMSYTLGTLGPDAAKYATVPGAVESFQNFADTSSREMRLDAVRHNSGMANTAATIAGMFGSGAKIARGMATPSNATAATAATFIPPLRLPIGAYYAVRGAMDTFAPQQPGESDPDAMERRLLGGASMAGGAAGAVSGFRPAVTATRGIASKAANTKIGQSIGIMAKPLAPVINDIPVVRGIAQGMKASVDVPEQLNEVWNPGIKSQLLGPSETSTSPYGSFEPAAIGMADSLPADAPTPTRVPIWSGVTSGQPPVLQPEPFPPATPRAAALAQNGLPQSSPTQATAPEAQSPAPQGANPVRGITQTPKVPAVNEIEQAATDSAQPIPEAMGINPLKAKTPQAAQTQVFKKLGIAAPGASAKPMTSIPSGAITPRPDLTFPRIIDPESAAMYQLSENVSPERLGINQLRAMAMQRSIPVEAADTHQILIRKLVNSLTDAERQQFENVLEDRAHIPDYSIW